MKRALTTLSLVTCAVSGWMFTMYFVLRHPGFLGRAGIAALIFLGAAAVATGLWRAASSARLLLGLWAAALLALGLWALFGASGDDGWVLIAGLLFVAEGVVALLVFSSGGTIMTSAGKV
jgi:hypothetical protein